MYMTITNTSYEQYRENEYERKMREFSTLPDPKRPSTERYIEYFYDCIAHDKTPDTSVIPHSDLFYIRAALEDKFPDRVFTIEEVRTLVDQELGIEYLAGKNTIFRNWGLTSFI